MSTQKKINWFQKHFPWIIVLLFVGLAVSISFVLQRAYLLNTASAPWGNISWQMNTDSLTQRVILREWQASKEKFRIYRSDTSYVRQETGLTVARRQNNADYVLIFFYSLVLAAFIYQINNWNIKAGTAFWNRHESAVWITVAFLAGLLDVIEDWKTGEALAKPESQQVAASTIVFFALAKMLLLGAAVLRIIYAIIQLKKLLPLLRLLTGWPASFARLAWRFRIVFIVLLLLFAVLYVSDQGQDLLVTINTSRLASVLFLIIASLLSLLCWYLPKVLEYSGNASYSNFFFKTADFEKDGYGHRSKPKVDFARLLGAAVFLILGTGVLQTMNNYHIWHILSTIPPFIVFIIIVLSYRTMLKNHWLEKWYKQPGTAKLYSGRFTWTVLSIAAIIISLGFVDYNRQPFFLFFLFIDLVLLSFLLLLLTTLRTCIASLHKLPLAPLIMLPALAALAFFIACNFPAFLNRVTINERFYTMPIVLCGVAAYLLFFSFLLFTGKKTGIQFITLLLLVAIYISSTKVSPYHNAAVLTKQQRYKEDSLETYILKWLNNRKPEITQYLKEHPGDDYPVFFANTYGGGIKAAAWTTMIIGTLDRLMIKRDRQPDDFTHYVFSWSGASGGTIGLSLLSGARYQDIKDKQPRRPFFPANSLEVYKKDYLTADIVALMGRDMLAGSFGLSPWPDRGRLMEQDWERHNRGRIAMEAAFGQLNQPGIPLFFSNTYDIDKGQKGITAPVKLNSLDFPSIIQLRESIARNEDLRLSTGAFLSARFPFVSPTAKLNGRHHFTDGGTYDNSGAETTMQVYAVFERIRAQLAQRDDLFQHIRPHFLAINSDVETGDSLVRVRNLSEAVAPLLGVINLAVGHTRKSIDGQFSFAKEKSFNAYLIKPSIIKIAKHQNSWPVLPLGWQISDDALLTMEMSATSHNTEIDKILAIFKPHMFPRVQKIKRQ